MKHKYLSEYELEVLTRHLSKAMEDAADELGVSPGFLIINVCNVEFWKDYETNFLDKHKDYR